MTEQENEDIFGFEQHPGKGPTSGTGPHDDFSKPGREFSFFTSLKQNGSCSVLYFLMHIMQYIFLSFSIYKVIIIIKKINKNVNQRLLLTISMSDSSFFCALKL